MTACQATPSQPGPLDAAMHLHGLERVRRTRGVVPAHLAVERADRQAIELQKTDQQVLHPCCPPHSGKIRARHRSRSRARPADEEPAAAGRARITIRHPGGSGLIRARNRCRNRRLTRLRTTELPTARLTTSPKTGSPAPPVISGASTSPLSVRAWTTSDRDAARRPRRVTSRKEEASPRRFAAASTSGLLRLPGSADQHGDLAQTARLLRPLRRRSDRIARPARVRMRRRKPCTL